MELYGVYLRAFIVGRCGADYRSETAGMSNPALAAAALAIHDAMHGREPKTIDALLAAVNAMCPEVVIACA